MLLLLLHLAGAPSSSESGRRSKAISWEVITNLQPHLPCILLLPTSAGNGVDCIYGSVSAGQEKRPLFVTFFRPLVGVVLGI